MTSACPVGRAHSQCPFHATSMQARYLPTSTFYTVVILFILILVPTMILTLIVILIPGVLFMQQACKHASHLSLLHTHLLHPHPFYHPDVQCDPDPEDPYPVYLSWHYRLHAKSQKGGIY